MGTVGISGAVPTDVGGAPAYKVSFSPKHDGGLLGSAELAFDAANGAPLHFAVYAQGNTSPVIDLTATQVSFGPVAAADVTVTPPAGANVVELSAPAAEGRTGSRQPPASEYGERSSRGRRGTPVQARCAGPAGRPPADVGPASEVRQEVRGRRGLRPAPRRDPRARTPARHAGAPAGAAKPASPGAAKSASSTGLPTVTVNGATGTELATALGTLIRFERGGIGYIVLGSVPPAAAEAAARGL